MDGGARMSKKGIGIALRNYSKYVKMLNPEGGEIVYRMAHAITVNPDAAFKKKGLPLTVQYDD